MRVDHALIDLEPIVAIIDGLGALGEREATALVAAVKTLRGNVVALRAELAKERAHGRKKK